METIEPLLAEHPLFKNMLPEYLKLLVGCAKNVRFNAGEMIFREGEAANALYLIRKGTVTLDVFVPERGPITITTLSDGDVIGWSWLIPPYRWHLDARAVELTRAITLDATCLRTKFEQDHELERELLRRYTPVIVERLKATIMQLLDLYSARHGKD
jgi:CRP/FNR family cyclic AMP-dependent transcriptional regulator